VIEQKLKPDIWQAIFFAAWQKIIQLPAHDFLNCSTETNSISVCEGYNMGKDKNKVDFSDDKLKAALASHENEAEQVISDGNKVKQLLSKAKGVLKKAEKVPVIGAILDDLLTMLDLIGDYAKGSYRNIPTRVIVSAVAGVIYFVSPIDLIPDVIPVLGWLDDVAVLTTLLGTGLSLELDKYRKWKEQQEIDELNMPVSEYEESAIHTDEEGYE
jgi:uncharacterized membrane protein YkvA (DUF1232 family)